MKTHTLLKYEQQLSEGKYENMCAVMGSEKEWLICDSPSEQLDFIHRWRDALEGSYKEIAFELLNQVLNGRIENEAAIAFLDSKHAL